MAQDRRARIATAALFLTNGAIFANLLPRYPEIKADLHLSNAVYGAAIAAFSGGALVAGLAAAALIRRFRSSRVAVVGTIGIAVFVVAAGLARSPLVLGATLIVGGVMGAGAIALHIGRSTHLAISAAVFSVVVVIAYPYLLRGPDHDDHP